MGKSEWLLVAIYLLLVVVVTMAGSKKKKGRKKVFFISLFLTPIAGIIIYLRGKEKNYDLGESRYIVSRYKCENCGYKFDEHYECCPICEKEGLKIELTEVKQIMT